MYRGSRKGVTPYCSVHHEDEEEEKGCWTKSRHNKQCGYPFVFIWERTCTSRVQTRRVTNTMKSLFVNSKKDFVSDYMRRSEKHKGMVWFCTGCLFVCFCMYLYYTKCKAWKLSAVGYKAERAKALAGKMSQENDVMKISRIYGLCIWYLLDLYIFFVV